MDPHTPLHLRGQVLFDHPPASRDAALTEARDHPVEGRVQGGATIGGCVEECQLRRARRRDTRGRDAEEAHRAARPMRLPECQRRVRQHLPSSVGPASVVRRVRSRNLPGPMRSVSFTFKTTTRPAYRRGGAGAPPLRRAR